MTPNTKAAEVTADIRLFVYGSLLRGERDHELLGGATFLGPMKTAPRYTLVDLGPYAALLERGRVSVAGELYIVDKKQRFALDVKRECPILFQRVSVELEDGSRAEAYVMRDEQVRGKRRLAQGDWRERFAAKPRSDALRGLMGPYGRRGPR